MTDAGYDDLLDALDAGDGYYLACPEGHGSLPPRRTCPHCGAMELTERELPASGTVETFTVVHVAGPEFTAETPYVTAVVDFGPVRLTGVLRGVDPDDVEVGLPVEPGVGSNETTGERIVTFHPQ